MSTDAYPLIDSSLFIGGGPPVDPGAPPYHGGGSYPQDGYGQPYFSGEGPVRDSAGPPPAYSYGAY